MIIESLLDTDLYKFTMMQVVLHKFPAAMVEYRFKCRSPGVDLRPYADEIHQEIAHYCQLKLREDELTYLSSLGYLKSDFIDFLRIFQANPSFVHINTDNEFELTIVGPWLHTILYEVPILAIISEVYFRNQHPNVSFEDGEQRLIAKCQFLQDNTEQGQFKFSDFGTRRRFSRQWHHQVVKTCIEHASPWLSGTSNVMLAKEFGITAIGTMAHEYIQACQSLGPRLLYSQKYAFEMWAQEYRGDLGIALSDTISIDAFINDFDLYFCKLFDGARHDSGDPILWGDRMVEHYQKNRVDPKSKLLVFSNSLSFKRAVEIQKHFAGRINTAFGVGTNLTNDLGPEPLDIVIKMVRCNNQPVAKISDEPAKIMCDDASYLEYLRKVFKVGA